jgi:hypothetical protein
MKTKSYRRTFLKQGAVLGGGVLLLGAEPPRACAADQQTNSPGGPPPPVNDTLKTIGSLRTIHGNFLDKPLPDSTLRRILRASVRAANASNMQSYSIVVVKDRAKMKAVCTYQGSCMLLYCVDFNRLRASAESLGYSYFPDNIEEFVTASINASLAVQTAAIAAKSLIALVLGYPTQEPPYQMGRLDGPGVIHYENYHRLTKEEVADITRQYDDEERHLALNGGWKAQGYKHYMDWWFKDWLQASKPTDQETQMLRFLKRSGFVELQKA